jgi:hypothetical protein
MFRFMPISGTIGAKPSLPALKRKGNYKKMENKAKRSAVIPVKGHKLRNKCGECLGRRLGIFQSRPCYHTKE